MKKLFLFFLPALWAFSCDRNQVVCTMELRMITVHVKNTNGNPAVLDSSYTLRTATNEKIRPEQHGSHGAYVVLDDSYHPVLKRREEHFRFIGWKNNTIVVDLPYTIAGDDCHIGKVAGADSVTIQ